MVINVNNRPGVAAAVLQTALWLIDSLSDPLVKISSKHSQSPTGRARKLKVWENCHVPCVTCHLSCVSCQVSRVTCHMSFFFSSFFIQKINIKKILKNKLDNVVELVGGGSVINGAYPSSFQSHHCRAVGILLRTKFKKLHLLWTDL